MKPVTHQFTLFEYNEMRPKLKIPVRRVSLQQYQEARKKLQAGDDRAYRAILSDVQDSLDRVLSRLK